MTFRERVESHPVGWSFVVGSAGFLAGVFVTLGFMQVIISDRGPRIAKNTTEPSPAPTFPLPVGPTGIKNPPPIASVTPADSGNMEMTIQQFTRKYLDLDGRYAEQEAFLKRADRKRVRWKVIFTYPASHGDRVTVYFDVPAESPNSMPLSGGRVNWANFPMNFRDRLYALKRGDLIEIAGILQLFDNDLVIAADDLDVITPTPSPTRSPTSKRRRDE